MVNPIKTSKIFIVALLLTLTLLGDFWGTSMLVSGESIASDLVINEFMANNAATTQSSSGNYTDWIELYNRGESSIDLGGMFLTDNLTDLKWQFSTGTVIIAHGYLLAWADGNVRLGSLQTNFKIDAKGGVIGLIASDGTTLMDSVTYDKQIQDISFGRTVDGGSNWNYMLKSTPGEANLGVSTFFTGYPWQLWAILSVAIAVCGLVIFKDKFFGGRKEHDP